MTSPTFWLLEEPDSQRLAEVAPDTELEQITCPVDEGHRRAGARIGDMSIRVHPSGVRDFTWVWGGDVLLSPRALSIFKQHDVTGFETRRAKVAYPKRSAAPPPELLELIVTGWGGPAAPAAGVSLVSSCPACGYKCYVIAEPGRLIDPSSWDGSDIFIVWPLPKYRFVSERFATIIRKEKLSGTKLIPASDIPIAKGTEASPGRLTYRMPEKRAREIGEPLGIA